MPPSATVRFVAVHDPSRPKAPYVAVDGNGNEVKSWDVRQMAFIREHLNEPLQVETTIKENGRYRDTYLEKVELPPPPSPNGSNGSWRPRDPAEERRIVRQSCLRTAVDYGGRAMTVDQVLTVAEQFARWVYNGVPRSQDEPPHPAESVAAKVGPSRRLSGR